MLGRREGAVAGETVLLRDAAGRLLIRKVWMEDAEKVYISAEPGLFPVGFPREDAFAPDPSALGSIADGSRPEPAFWEALTPW